MKTLIFPVTKKEAEKAGTSYSSEANKNALFPSQLRDLRKEKGVSQETVARDLGVSKSTIGLYETGDTLPDAKTLYALAKYYAVSADYLLGLSSYTKNENVGISAIDLGMNENAAKKQAEFWKRISCDMNELFAGNIKYGGFWQFYMTIWNNFLSSKSFFEILRSVGDYVSHSIENYLICKAPLPIDTDAIDRLAGGFHLKKIENEEERKKYLKSNTPLPQSYFAWKLEKEFLSWVDLCAKEISENQLRSYFEQLKKQKTAPGDANTRDG